MSEKEAPKTFEEMVQKNIWHHRDNLQKVLDALKPCFTPHPEKPYGSINGWSWVKTPKWAMKYIDIRIDMRDGGFILYARDGAQRVSLEQILEQIQD